MNLLEQACYDIIMKNMSRTDEKIYLLYDTESPLAKIVSSAYITVLQIIQSEQDISLHSKWQEQENIVIREFQNPPQPLYRGGMVNPENPHIKEQNRLMTSHNINENVQVWLDHHKTIEVKALANTSSVVSEEYNQLEQFIDPQIDSIKDELISLPPWSIVLLVQSTNFRLSTFRIRLELFNRGIHVVELNHLAYIPEEQFPTFEDALVYRTDEYVRLEKEFAKRMEVADNIRIQSVNWSILTFWAVENIRGNTGDYTDIANKWGTYPIWEVFTEAKVLDSVSGTVMIDTYPNEDFSIAVCEPFALTIEHGRVLPSQDFPPGFQKLYDWVVQYEGEVMVRELGFGLNPAITTLSPLRDINFHERKLGVHLSLGKKHGIYGKKLPKTDIQRFHIDVFVALDAVYIGELKVFENGRWSL